MQISFLQTLLHQCLGVPLQTVNLMLLPFVHRDLPNSLAHRHNDLWEQYQQLKRLRHNSLMLPSLVIPGIDLSYKPGTTNLRRLLAPFLPYLALCQFPRISRGFGAGLFAKFPLICEDHHFQSQDIALSHLRQPTQHCIPQFEE